MADLELASCRSREPERHRRLTSFPRSVINGGFPNGMHDLNGRTIPSVVPNTTLPGLIDAATPTSAYTRYVLYTPEAEGMR
jgi:hypothetical protein